MGGHFCYLLIINSETITHHFWTHKGIPTMAASRLQKWAIISAYTYTIAYKPTKEHSNADYLSRLPDPEFEKFLT